MAPPTIDASTELLVQFLANVSRCSDSASAAQIAAERAAAAFEAEVGAVLLDGVLTSVGFPQGQVLDDQLSAVAQRISNEFTVPGVGTCAAMSAPLDERATGRLIVGRADGAFTAEESNLLRGMARTLQLVLIMLKTLGDERAMREHADRQAEENAGLLISIGERNDLLEHLISIQRAISRQAPLDEVLDSVVSGAHELLNCEVASLVLVDPLDPYRLVLARYRGLSQSSAAGSEVAASPQEIGAEAMASATLVVKPAAMAAPVYDGKSMVGALVISFLSGQHEFDEAQQSCLAAFAQQVSLAITDARTLEDMWKANHDPLTGLASRRLFMECLQAAVSEAERSQTQLAVLFLDLDRFKMINDTLGHQAGDQLLIEVAERIRTCLRAGDSASRLGGDEFAVLLQDVANSRYAPAIAQRILTALRPPMTIEGREVFIDASVGVVTSGGGPDCDAESLLRDADVAMYEAKRSGTGRTAVFRAPMRARLQDRVQLESDLRRALDSDELHLEYQPIVGLGNGAVEGVEALLRWLHPTRGLVGPETFIPMAEETGLIVPLGELVLRLACEQAATWQRILPIGAAPYVSVNISGRQLNQLDLARHVSRALEEADLPANSLVLELTESMLLDNGPMTQHKLAQLTELGVRLAVDDFGSGWSSLSYLRTFPIDFLKIDKSFIDGVAMDSSAASLARAVIELGAALHLHTVANGVETAEQVRTLGELGCDSAQGFHFSPPLDGPMIQNYLLHKAIQATAHGTGAAVLAQAAALTARSAGP